ncbi:MAG: hypothetical protein ACTSQP_08165 [Promethearchaeota archaeon]
MMTFRSRLEHLLCSKKKKKIIRPENLPKDFRKDGIIYCRYEIGKSIILKLL